MLSVSPRAGSSNAEVKDGNEGEEELLQKVNKPSKPKRTYPADVPEAAQGPADTSGSSMKAVAVSQASQPPCAHASL